MKKIGILLMTLILVTGCFNKKVDYDKVMGEYAVDYYTKYAFNLGVDKPRVEINNLKAANEQVDAKYDLKKLAKCTDDSYVDLVLDEEKQVKEIIYRMNCK
jgi:hypothetical protein